MPTKSKKLQSVYFKRWYEKNRKREIARVLKHRTRRLEELESWIIELKSVPCKDCGRCFPPVAMDFDHVRGKKIQSISIMLRKGYSIAKIKAEVAKCEVVCACCHRVRTHTQTIGA